MYNVGRPKCFYSVDHLDHYYPFLNVYMPSLVTTVLLKYSYLDGSGKIDGGEAACTCADGKLSLGNKTVLSKHLPDRKRDLIEVACSGRGDGVGWDKCFGWDSVPQCLYPCHTGGAVPLRCLYGINRSGTAIVAVVPQ